MSETRCRVEGQCYKAHSGIGQNLVSFFRLLESWDQKSSFTVVGNSTVEGDGERGLQGSPQNPGRCGTRPAERQGRHRPLKVARCPKGHRKCGDEG